MRKSLKRRLLKILLSLILVGWIFSALITFLHASSALLDQVDQQLDLVLGVSQTTIWALSEQAGKDISSYFSDKVTTEGDYLRIADPDVPGMFEGPALNLWIGDQQVLFGNAPAFSPPSGDLSHFEKFGEGDSEIWRIIYRHDERTGIWLAAGVDIEQAQIDGAWLLGGMIMPLLFILPLTGFAIYYGTGSGLKPLRRLARQIEARSPNSLEPVEAGTAPYEEIKPLTSSLNVLLQRLEQTLQAEQRITANAAHELQTPLAAIKTEVQLCERRVCDDQTRQMLGRITDRVDRASHSVKQLLTLARLEPEVSLAGEQLVLQTLVEEVLVELGHVAEQQKLQVEVDAKVAGTIQGDRESLLIMLRNLLGNALRNTPAGGHIKVSIRSSPASTELCIENDCMPMDDAEVARLGERFYRRPGNTYQGAGLGLSIVTRVAQLHRATLNYSYLKEQKTFRVQLWFTQ